MRATQQRVSTERKTCPSKIIAEISELETTAASARAALKESSEANPNFLQDECDSAKSERDLENTLCIYHHALAQRRTLVDALASMNNGAYGICIECDNEIGLRRLDFIPGAVLCVCCQEAREMS